MSGLNFFISILGKTTFWKLHLWDFQILNSSRNQSSPGSCWSSTGHVIQMLQGSDTREGEWRRTSLISVRIMINTSTGMQSWLVKWSKVTKTRENWPLNMTVKWTRPPNILMYPNTKIFSSLTCFLMRASTRPRQRDSSRSCTATAKRTWSN